MLQIKMNSGNGSIKIPLKKNIEESGNFGPQTPYSVCILKLLNYFLRGFKFYQKKKKIVRVKELFVLFRNCKFQIKFRNTIKTAVFFRFNSLEVL